MALSGRDIFKLLPKTNCGDCGVPTCMAFAMKIAQKKAELSSCPHASEEAKAALGAASEPPVRQVKIGPGSGWEVGGETVLFRHEKTFFHPAGIGLEIRTSWSEEEIRECVRQVEGFQVDRVGEVLKVNLFFITHDSREKSAFLKAVSLIKENSSKGLIIDCPDEDALKEGLELLRSDRPAVFLRRSLTEGDIQTAKAFGSSLVITAASLQDLADQAEKAKKAGLSDLILNSPGDGLGAAVQNNAILRRSALKKGFKPFGFPLFTRIAGEDGTETLAASAALLCKYASIIILPRFDRALLYALFTLRQNIYTDPQKPIQVDPKIYGIGDPNPGSPVFVTTNFSLTYFIVSGEIENSGTSAHLVVCDTEGQSVLTAWAGGKFVPEKIAKFIKDIKLEEKVKTRKIVIPGFVAQI
ncbi:MAG: dehydrogenase/acetyl-CoA synthase delta subunit, barrel, partial [Candidatus Aminicenantes bacterium]|nr:dehydrogenase/acetyl-CoA synthase delta subunit, barrel [Candidatus Aminicenantes bacterium]